VEHDSLPSVGQGTPAADAMDASPQPSPPRESVLQTQPADTSTEVPSPDPGKEMGEVHQEEEHQEADLAKGSLSTIVPGSASPTRASTAEPVHTGAIPTTKNVEGSVPTTQVPMGGDVPPQQVPTGNPLIIAYLSQNFGFLFLRFESHFYPCFLPWSTVPTSPEEGEELVEVADIAKAAAEEATKIAIAEGLEQVAGDIKEAPDEPEGSHGNKSEPTKMDVDELPTTNVTPYLVNQPAAATP
jgi:hypothetical protein